MPPSLASTIEKSHRRAVTDLVRASLQEPMRPVGDSLQEPMQPVGVSLKEPMQPV